MHPGAPGGSPSDAAEALERLQRMDLPSVWAALRPLVRPALALNSPALDAALGTRVTLYSETFQHTGSFKFRAAMSAVLHSKAPRLLTVSSGNFGAALACAAARWGKACTVAMPQQSSRVKIAAVRAHGATVDLIDTTRTSRSERLAELAAADPEAQPISPYDDPYVVAGNSSLGAEIFGAPEGPPQVLVAPVGGGGLSAGLVLARDRLAPTCEVIGAEPLAANDAARSLRAGRLECNPDEGNTLCDGARTRSLGQIGFHVLRRGMAAIVEVREVTVAQAVRLLFEAVHLKAEPTGALSVAAVL
ncbi:MAG: pyridoxal-phosphate dependent enzyme, partial [Myxococcota bacterium]|nr:pyridoxal-phosphate dependent enzyme [Myxococcota bacterium]